MMIENCCTPTVIPVDVRSLRIANIGFGESGDQLCGHMAAMLDQVRLDGSLWLMRVMMCVNTIVHSAENEMVGWKTLRLRLSDGTEVLT